MVLSFSSGRQGTLFVIVSKPRLLAGWYLMPRPDIQPGAYNALPHRGPEPLEFGRGKQPVQVGGCDAFVMDREPSPVRIVAQKFFPRLAAGR
ncbi:unnamed protein product [Sphagnum troendelagicum]|uniref:Uncharacterized protein n=1 Tax=Sphagnum troendelagicum TaxID=128251 RepID=A0ABP0TSU1_9BRYO